jgi:hypothetical protein
VVAITHLQVDRAGSTRLSAAPMLIYTFAVALPWRIVPLLLPDRQGAKRN